MLLPLRCLSRQCARSGLPKWQASQATAQWGRCFSETVEDEDDEDIVLKTFREQQEAFRVVMEGIKHINVPLDGNAAGVRKYASEMEALKRKAGLPDVEEVVDARLEYQARCSQGDIRKFLVESCEGVDLGKHAYVVDELLAAVDEVEAATGSTLTSDDEEAMASFGSRVQAIQEKAGLTDYAKLKDDFLQNMYTKQISEARSAAEDGMDALKRKEGLEGLEVSAADLKLTW